MASFFEEYQKEADDIRHQSFVDWRERVLRVEDLSTCRKAPNAEQEQAENAEWLKTYNGWAHENPQGHLKRLKKELDREYFCIMNKVPYEPSFIGGLPGYWEYRKENLEIAFHNNRQRLPNE
jgi:hypothetical protein